MYFVLVNIQALEIPGDREEQIRPVKMLKLNEKVQKQAQTAIHYRMHSKMQCERIKTAGDFALLQALERDMGRLILSFIKNQGKSRYQVKTPNQIQLLNA